MITSMKRQAQALTKACHYHYLGSLAQSDRLANPHTCCAGNRDADFVCGSCERAAAEADAEAEFFWRRRDKALNRCGDHVEILLEIQTSEDVMAAAMRTVRLLGTDSVGVHAFGPGCHALGSVVVTAD